MTPQLPCNQCNFTIFHYLLPYPSGRVAAYHNRAGISPMLVASDQHRPGTGPPWQVHRIRALVCAYYMNIPRYKYKIMKTNLQMKMRQWQSWRGSPQQIPYATTHSSPQRAYECLPRRIENATQPLPQAIVQTHQPRWQPQATQTMSCRSPRMPPALNIRNVHRIVIDCGEKYNSWQWSTQLDSGWAKVIWCRTRILECCELKLSPTGVAGLC